MRSFLLALAFCAWASSAEATIAFVTGNALHTEADAAGTTLTSSAFTNNITTNNLIIAACSWASGATTDATVTDSAGNTYTSTETLPYYQASDGVAFKMFYTVITAGGGTKPTVQCNFWTTTAHTVASSQSYRVILAAEFSGAATSTPLDKHGTNEVLDPDSIGLNGIKAPAATVLPATDNQMVVGVVGQTNGGAGRTAVMSAGTGYTELARAVTVSPADYPYQLEYNVQTTATAVQTTWSVSITSSTDRYIMVMGTFTAAAAAAATAPKHRVIGQ